MIHGLDLDDHTRPPLARLNSSGLPISAKQANKVWRGLVQVEGSMEPAIPVALKWIGGETKLATELGCSLAASVLGLPVPKGLLVLAGRDQLPGLSAAAKPTLGGNDVLCFASVYQWPDDTWARLSDDESASEYSFSHLCETSQAAPGAAWDELAC
jgi:hypothetical protein